MRKLKIHGIYKHFKGDYYLVEDVGLYSETQEECVIYRHLYGDGSLCIRPLKMFLSEDGITGDYILYKVEKNLNVW